MNVLLFVEDLLINQDTNFALKKSVLELNQVMAYRDQKKKTVKIK